MIMKLGMCVINDRYASTVVAILACAERREISVRCFLTDRGILLLADKAFIQCLENPNVHFSVCELSVERYSGSGVNAHDWADRLIVGGQYQNAELVRTCDRVLVF